MRSETPGSPRRATEAEETDVPAARATSTIVTRSDRFMVTSVMALRLLEKYVLTCYPSDP